MLRSYLPKDHALKPMELGSEPTPAAYVANMVKVFRLVRDVMADHAVCWLNIGDSYASNSTLGRKDGGKSTDGTRRNPIARMSNDGPVNRIGDLTEGSLCLIPQRLAIALQDDGWIVRSVIVWHKPAPMPASLSGWAWRRCRVKVSYSKKPGYHPGRGQDDITNNHLASKSDKSLNAQWQDCPGCDKCRPHGGYVLRRGSWRPTSSWEPILMLAKSAKYYADGEAVKTTSAPATVSRNLYTRVLDDPDEQFAVKHDHETTAAGANLRDVWRTKLEDLSKEELVNLVRGMDDGSLPDVFRIAAEPLKAKHYAAFPTELVHRCLASSTSAKGYCPTCGGPWCRVMSEATGGTIGKGDWTVGADTTVSGFTDTPVNPGAHWQSYIPSTTLGWRPSCACPPHEPRPGLVLDPFAGSGRTGVEALRMGLDFIGIDLNPEYVQMASRILRDESPLFAEAGHE